MKKIMITGGRPTGKLHLGHYEGAFKPFVDLQEKYKNFFIISDMHMLTTKNTKKEVDTIYDNALNMVIDAIGMGVDPKKTSFYLQSQIPSQAFVFEIFQNYVKIDRVINTASLQEMSKNSSRDDVSLGLVAYPVLEAADIFGIGADIVPVGRDNVDHLLITQAIVKHLNKEFGAKFKIPEYFTPENNRVIGLDGSNKMSKSLNNSIYIRDTDEEVAEKITSMKWYKYGDDELNVVVEYIKIFAPEQYDDLYAKFTKDKLDEKDAKTVLIESLHDLMQPMRERMTPYVEDKEKALKLLHDGSMEAKNIIDASAAKLREAMGMVNLENHLK